MKCWNIGYKRNLKFQLDSSNKVKISDKVQRETGNYFKFLA